MFTELPSLTDREPSFIDPDICEISDDESPQISNLEVVATTLKDLRVILPRSNPADLVKRYESQCQKDNKKENEKDDKKEKQNHGAVYSRDRAISSDSDSSESELRKIADGDDDCDDFNYAPPSRSPIDRSAPLPSAKKKIKETQQIQKKLSLICDSEDGEPIL